MEKKLVMIFKDTADMKHNITVNNIRDGITVDEIKAVMDAILSTGVFKAKGGSLVSKHSAEIVDTTTTVYNNVK